MEINITDAVYNAFKNRPHSQIENSPVRPEGMDFWDIFTTPEADISGDEVLHNFFTNLKTETPA